MLEATPRRIPLSKSIAARVLILDSLSGQNTPTDVLPACKDISVLAEALDSQNGNKAEINVGDSGTALRFLTAYFAAKAGAEVVLSGSDRLVRRPLKALVEALRSLGADIEYLDKEGFAPIRIKGLVLDGGEVELDASQSSQFASALALIAPTMKYGLRINLGGQIPSMPYLKMTLAMLEHRGIDAHIEGYTAVIPGGTLQHTEPECEPDWSAASYWYTIAAASAGWVTLPEFKENSLQGDSVLKTLGLRFGVVTEFTEDGAELSATPDLYSRLDLDMSDWPDLVPALAVVGCILGLPYIFTGVGNLRHKESDRLAVLSENLAQLGFITEIGADSFTWESERTPIFKFPEIDPHNDHRMAMAFAIASFYCPGIVIHNPETVEKSYPGFFDDLADAGFTICSPDDPIPEEFLEQQ